MIPALDRLRKGDLESLSELIPLYQDRLFRYLVRMVGDATVAEDLFQDTWIKASESIRRYDPSRAFDHWLFAIAHNLTIDFLRRRRPEVLAEARLTVNTRSALALVLDAERTTATLAAIGELPACYREVVTLRFEEEMKLEEIAAVTRTPLATVKTRLRRALGSLRERFQCKITTNCANFWRSPRRKSFRKKRRTDCARMPPNARHARGSLHRSARRSSV